MRKFKLVKKYPACNLEIGSCIEFIGSCQQIININGNFLKSDLEKFTEFWQEVVEKDYEILSERTHIPSGSTEIYSIRRKSDGVEFKIGDKVCWDWQYSSQKYYTINKFFIREEDNSIGFYTKESCAYSWLFNKIQHYKEPILTTEDGYECTLDDRVFGVLPKGVWETCVKEVSTATLFIQNKHKEKSAWLYFKTAENRAKYIYENKPEFSRKDLYRLTELLKSHTFSYWDILIKSFK